MTIKHYQNKYNANKWLEVHYYKNHHVGVAQYIVNNNGYNPTCNVPRPNYVMRAKGRRNSKGIQYMSKAYLTSLLEDYNEK